MDSVISNFGSNGTREQRNLYAVLTSFTSNVTEAVAYHSPDYWQRRQHTLETPWLNAPPITAVGLHLSNEAITVAVSCVWVSIYVNHINVNVNVAL